MPAVSEDITEGNLLQTTIQVTVLQWVSVNHTPATYSQKWLTDMMLDENPLLLT